MSRLALLATGILGGMIPALALAQSPVPYSQSIVVTATLAPEPANEISATATVLDETEIDRRQAPLALDLLRSVPGVVAAQQGSPGKLGSLFVRGANANQTLVLWNGVKLNDPYFGGFDWAFLPADGLDRIEVVAGPYSALYGSEAVGGVVQLLTRRGEGGKVRVEAGSRNYRRASLAAGHQSGPVHFDVVGHLRRGEGELPNDFYDGEELALRGVWQARPSLELGLLARGGRATIGLPRDYYGQPSRAREQRLDTRTLAIPATWTGSAWSVEAQASRYRTDLELADPANPFDESTALAGRTQARAVVSRAAGDSGWVAGGVEWERQSVDATSAFDALRGAHQRTAAVFAQGFVRWGRARFDLGARRDDNDVFGGHTSSKAGLSAALTERLRLRASYGESFRAPSLTDLYYPGYGNPDLRPEIGRSVELALEGGGGPWRFSLAAFESRLTDLFQVDFTTFRPFNTGRARSRGIEATVAGRAAHADGRLAWTWLDTEDRTTGRPLLKRPKWSGSLVAGGSFAAWRVGTVVRYVGERFDFGNLPLAAYTAVDFTADWQAARRLRPYARLENAFAERYEEAAGYPAPGRRWSAGVAWTF